MSDHEDRRQSAWQRLVTAYAEGDAIAGVVTRRLRAGLLVDVGVEVFLPAYQEVARGRHTHAPAAGRDRGSCHAD